MAYDLLKREFGTMTGLVGHSLEAYTVQDIVYGINHALSEAGIPFGLFDPRYREHPWYLRQERLGEANILKHFHAQESNFLQRKREHDNNPNARDKDDPWTYFRDHQERSFVPARDLPAAYLVLGYTLDSHTSLSFHFLPTHMYDLYPEFFAGRSIKQANGGEYTPEVHLTPAQEASFFEMLWKHIEQDLVDHGLLKNARPTKSISNPPIHKAERESIAESSHTGSLLTDTESNVLEALGTTHLNGKELLRKAGYDYSSHYRQILSNLLKRGILGNDRAGYFRKGT